MSDNIEIPEDLNEIEQFAGIAEPKKRRFLAAFLCHGRIMPAAEEAGVSRGSHYFWMLQDEQYREAYYACRQWICDRIEEGLIDRLIYGWDEPVFHEGNICGHKRKFDNAACLRYLERVNPKVFGPETDDMPSEKKIPLADVLAAMTKTVMTNPDKDESNA